MADWSLPFGANLAPGGVAFRVWAPKARRVEVELIEPAALRLAVGREVGEDRSGEMLDLLGDPAPVHLFDCYAMANIRLCSATATGKSNSKGTATMSRNCLRHLKATVKILEPTRCIIQGLKRRV